MNSAALSSKARSLTSLHFNMEDYKYLSSQDSVGSILEVLKRNNRYSDIVASLSKEEVHRDELEGKLRLIVPQEYLRLAKYSKLKESPYLMHIERDLVINKLYALLTGTSFDVNRDILEFSDLISFDIQSLRAVNDLDGFIHLMSASSFHDFFKKWDPSTPLWYTEVKLCVYVHKVSVEKNAHNVTLKDILDTEFVMEIMHLLFHLFLFSRDKAIQALNALPNRCAKLSKDTLKQWLYSSETLDAYKDKVADYFNTPPFVARLRLKQVFNYYREKHYSHLLRTTYDAATLLYAYSMLNEIEVEILIRVIENVRYQVPKEEIYRQIVTKEGF